MPHSIPLAMLPSNPNHPECVYLLRDCLAHSSAAVASSACLGWLLSSSSPPLAIAHHHLLLSIPLIV